MTTLAKDFYFTEPGGERRHYPAGTDHTAIPSDALQTMSDPSLWTGGTAPAGTTPPAPTSGAKQDVDIQIWVPDTSNPEMIASVPIDGTDHFFPTLASGPFLLGAGESFELHAAGPDYISPIESDLIVNTEMIVANMAGTQRMVASTAAAAIAGGTYGGALVFDSAYGAVGSDLSRTSGNTRITSAAGGLFTVALNFLKIRATA